MIKYIVKKVIGWEKVLIEYGRVKYCVQNIDMFMFLIFMLGKGIYSNGFYIFLCLKKFFKLK